MQFNYVETFKTELQAIEAYIFVLSNCMPEGQRLEKREALFMALTTLAKNKGVDISNYDALFNFMKENSDGEFSTKQKISTYKSKVAAKKWCRSSWGKMELPNGLVNLMNEDGEIDIKIKFRYNG